jgi:hypothetical protein
MTFIEHLSGLPCVCLVLLASKERQAQGRRPGKVSWQMQRWKMLAPQYKSFLLNFLHYLEIN